MSPLFAVTNHAQRVSWRTGSSVETQLFVGKAVNYPGWVA